MPQRKGATWTTTSRGGLSHAAAGARGGRPGLAPLSDATRAEAVGRVLAGESYRAVARELGVSMDTVGRWARAERAKNPGEGAEEA